MATKITTIRALTLDFELHGINSKAWSFFFCPSFLATFNNLVGFDHSHKNHGLKGKGVIVLTFLLRDQVDGMLPVLAPSDAYKMLTKTCFWVQDKNKLRTTHSSRV